MKYADASFERSNYQLNNLWEFSINANRENEWPLITYVQEASLPFINLTTETRNTGEKNYNGFTPIEGFSITFLENTDFSTHDYFRDWLSNVFDEKKGTFISIGPNIEKGSADDLVHRTGQLSFNTFEEDNEEKIDILVKELTKDLQRTTIQTGEFLKSVPRRTLTVEEIKRSVVQTIQTTQHSIPKAPTVLVTKEILSNIFTALGRQTVNAVAGTANRYANYGRRLTGQPTKSQFTMPPPPTRKAYELIMSPAGYRIDFETIRERPSRQRQRINIGEDYAQESPQEDIIEAVTKEVNTQLLEAKKRNLREKQTRFFIYEGLKILGLSEISLSYGDSGPLQYTVNFTADRIIS